MTAADPGKRFAFDVFLGPLPISNWEYTLDETDAGCRVTESWTDKRGFVIRKLGKAATGVGDRVGHNREGMDETLRRLGAAAEG